MCGVCLHRFLCKSVMLRERVERWSCAIVREWITNWFCRENVEELYQIYLLDIICFEFFCEFTNIKFRYSQNTARTWNNLNTICTPIHFNSICLWLWSLCSGCYLIIYGLNQRVTELGSFWQHNFCGSGHYHIHTLENACEARLDWFNSLTNTVSVGNRCTACAHVCVSECEWV